MGISGLAPGSISIVLAAVKFYADSLDLDIPTGTLTRNALKYIRRDGLGRGPGLVLGMRWEQADAVEDGPLFRSIHWGGHVQDDRLTPRALLTIIKSRARHRREASIWTMISGPTLDKRSAAVKYCSRIEREVRGMLSI